MHYIETLYLNCNSDTIAKPETSHCIRFCSSTMYSHATIISQLANAFNKAQLLWQEGSISTPYHISIVFPVELDHRRKPDDSESVYERLKWYINNMREPSCGAIVSFYQNKQSKPWITSPWHLNEFWPMKRQWDPQNTHVTIQVAEKMIGSTSKDFIHSVTPNFIDKVCDLATDYGFDVKFIDYTMPFEQMYNDIVTSNHHFSYCGATYFFAATVGVPTTGWGYFISPNTRQTDSYYEYDLGPDGTPQRVFVNAQLTQWGNLSTNKARIMQFDSKLGVVMNKPISYCTNIDDPDKLEETFAKMIL